MRRVFKNRISLNQKGASLAEYTLILSLVVVGCLGILVVIGVDLGCYYFTITGQTDVAFRGAMGTSGNSAFDLNSDGVVNDADLQIYRNQGCTGPF